METIRIINFIITAIFAVCYSYQFIYVPVSLWMQHREKKAKKATMSEEEAKTLYMEANAMKDENPEEAKKMLQKIINSVDPSSKRYKKAKELLEKL